MERQPTQFNNLYLNYLLKIKKWQVLTSEKKTQQVTEKDINIIFKDWMEAPFMDKKDIILQNADKEQEHPELDTPELESEPTTDPKKDPDPNPDDFTPPENKFPLL